MSRFVLVKYSHTDPTCNYCGHGSTGLNTGGRTRLLCLVLLLNHYLVRLLSTTEVHTYDDFWMFPFCNLYTEI